MENLGKTQDIWKGFLGWISGLKLNLIIMFMEVIVEALYTNAIVMGEHTGKRLKSRWRETSIFKKGEERKENKKGL